MKNKQKGKIQETLFRGFSKLDSQNSTVKTRQSKLIWKEMEKYAGSQNLIHHVKILLCKNALNTSVVIFKRSTTKNETLF